MNDIREKLEAENKLLKKKYENKIYIIWMKTIILINFFALGYILGCLIRMLLHIK